MRRVRKVNARKSHRVRGEHIDFNVFSSHLVGLRVE